jgi:sugar phosphate isomerase/epimerase
MELSYATAENPQPAEASSTPPQRVAEPIMNRRHFIAAGTAAAAWTATGQQAAAAPTFSFRYMLASSMYGELSLDEILPEVTKTGATCIDIWPRKHGNQREQVDAMGIETFKGKLEKHGVRLGCSTRYDLGPFGLADEMAFVSDLGGDLLVTGGKGPKKLEGAELKKAVGEFAEKLKPHATKARELKVRVAIENHGNNLIDSADSLKWLAELADPEIGIGLAPYHLENLGLGASELADLIEALGERMFLLYAWQHGKGCMKPAPIDDLLQQMPGRGPLDFAPIVAALKKSNFRGYTEIFMHPVPRGIPILPTAAETTAEIIKAKKHLESPW